MIVLQPQRAFEIEIVRRLVEEQADRARRRGGRRARRACASRRKTPSTAAVAPLRQSQVRRECARHATAPNRRRCRRAAFRSRRCASDPSRFPARRAARHAPCPPRARRSMQRFRPAGASCATRPMRARVGMRMRRFRYQFRRRSRETAWSCRVPLRPTTPTRARSGIDTEACSSRSLPAMRSEMSSRTIMRAFWQAQTGAASRHRA